MSKRKLKPRTPPAPSNSPEEFDPRTPKANLESNRILHSASTPLSSTSSNSNNEVSRKSKGDVSISNNRVELKRCSGVRKIKKQTREVPNGIETEGGRGLKKGRKSVDGCIVFSSETVEERTRRKRGSGIKDGNLSKDFKRKRISDSFKDTLGVNLSKEFEGENKKRVRHSDDCRNERKHGNRSYNTELQGDSNPVSCKKSDIGVFDNEKTQEGVKLVGDTTQGEKGSNVRRGKVRNGKKTMLNQCTDKRDCAKGWTLEQEKALQRAYFAAKPTPHFWKRVSKTVPGKSAQDCFDKIHSAYVTPPQAQPRSRAKNITLSSLSFSASNLLSSPEPERKRSRYKRSSHLAKKTARQLLQKQCSNDQLGGADLFSMFEPVDLSIGDSQQTTSCFTPEQNKRASCFLNSCHDTSPSADTKSISQLNMSCGECLISPPVLKQIKNKALHEKYIDQLHRRETKRKAALVRAAKQVSSQKSKQKIQDGKSDTLNAAKNSLYFDACDAINQFQRSQMKAVYSCELSDNDHTESSNDESEDWP